MSPNKRGRPPEDWIDKEVERITTTRTLIAEASVSAEFVGMLDQPSNVILRDEDGREIGVGTVFCRSVDEERSETCIRFMLRPKAWQRVQDRIRAKGVERPFTIGLFNG